MKRRLQCPSLWANGQLPGCFVRVGRCCASAKSHDPDRRVFWKSTIRVGAKRAKFINRTLTGLVSFFRPPKPVTEARTTRTARQKTNSGQTPNHRIIARKLWGVSLPTICMWSSEDSAGSLRSPLVCPFGAVSGAGTTGVPSCGGVEFRRSTILQWIFTVDIWMRGQQVWVRRRTREVQTLPQGTKQPFVCPHTWHRLYFTKITGTRAISMGWLGSVDLVQVVTRLVGYECVKEMEVRRDAPLVPFGGQSLIWLDEESSSLARATLTGRLSTRANAWTCHSIWVNWSHYPWWRQLSAAKSAGKTGDCAYCAKKAEKMCATHSGPLLEKGQVGEAGGVGDLMHAKAIKECTSPVLTMWQPAGDDDDGLQSVRERVRFSLMNDTAQGKTSVKITVCDTPHLHRSHRAIAPTTEFC